MLHRKTDEHVNPSVEVHHFVGTLSTAENLLTEVQRKVPTCPGKDFMLTLYKLTLYKLTLYKRYAMPSNFRHGVLLKLKLAQCV